MWRFGKCMVCTCHRFILIVMAGHVIPVHGIRNVQTELKRTYSVRRGEDRGFWDRGFRRETSIYCVCKLQRTGLRSCLFAIYSLRYRYSQSLNNLWRYGLVGLCCNCASALCACRKLDRICNLLTFPNFVLCSY